MSNVWFCSDLHLGHKNIGNFRRQMGSQWASESDNKASIYRDFIDNVTKRDIVYCLGDIAFTMEAMEGFRQLPGKKYLIRGNHDLLNTSAYLKGFEEVYGLYKYKEFWLSHAPIHPAELRGKVNLHGHVHYATVMEPWEEYYNESPSPDRRYFNCCPENLWTMYGRCLVSLDELRKYYGENPTF